MSSSIRVSNIPSASDNKTIHSLFLSFGNIIELKSQNNYVDIHFQDIEDAQAAIDNMSGFKLFDRYLQVTKIGELVKNPLEKIERNKAVWEMEDADDDDGTEKIT